jgi:hypothetical protein
VDPVPDPLLLRKCESAGIEPGTSGFVARNYLDATGTNVFRPYANEEFLRTYARPVLLTSADALNGISVKLSTLVQFFVTRKMKRLYYYTVTCML